jgi:hypothetical protein
MTLEEIDAELVRLPTTPTNDADFNARAALMARRCELDQAARAAANRQPKPRGNLQVFVPPTLGISHFISERGREAQARMTEEGRLVLDLFVGEFKGLLSGQNGHSLLWQECNPDAMRALGQP